MILNRFLTRAENTQQGRQQLCLLCWGFEFLGRHGNVSAVSGRGATLQFLVPWLIGLIYAVAFLRIDLQAMIKTALRPKQILWTGLIGLLILVALPLLMIGLCLIIGIDARYMPSAVWYAVAPPIASTAWMCGLLGLNMAFAIEIVVATSLISPFTGPLLARVFLGGSVPVSSSEMLIDLVVMIFGGVLAAQIWQKKVGKTWIINHDTALSGLSALAMLVFLIPVFDGVLPRIMEAPETAIHLLMLAFGLNFSTQFGFLIFTRLVSEKKTAETFAVLAVVSGNRNIGLYYGALPPDPIFGLFTALYQLPLYLTPVVVGLLYPRQS